MLTLLRTASLSLTASNTNQDSLQGSSEQHPAHLVGLVFIQLHRNVFMWFLFILLFSCTTFTARNCSLLAVRYCSVFSSMSWHLPGRWRWHTTFEHKTNDMKVQCFSFTFRSCWKSAWMTSNFLLFHIKTPETQFQINPFWSVKQPPMKIKFTK